MKTETKAPCVGSGAMVRGGLTNAEVLALAEDYERKARDAAIDAERMRLNGGYGWLTQTRHEITRDLLREVATDLRRHAAAAIDRQPTSNT